MAGKVSKLVLFLVISSLLLSAELLAKAPVYTGFLSNLAVGGYDTVSYFTESKAIKGSKEFSTEYKGATWYFSSQENLVAFTNNPEKYAPQYGGYCAWAVSQGYTAKGDPQQWSIHEDKLYLNYNADVQNRWLVDKENFILQGDKNWPQVLK